jgi:outer membrane protein TolC
MFAVPATVLTVALAVAAIPGGPATPDRVLTISAPDTLRLADAQRAARTANPMLRAERLAALAARERIAPAGALADPQLEFGLENRMLKGFGTEDPMTMNTVRISQMLPWPGKRTAARDGATALAEADSLAALEQEAMLDARVAMAYLDAALADRVLAVMGETLRLLRSFHETAMGMYAVGQAIQQDVLQAQVSVARMAADTLAMAGDRAAAAARLNALLAREPDSLVPALEYPAVADTLPAMDSLAARAFRGRPALAAAQARIVAADRAIEGAGRESYPDLMLGAAYQARPRYDDMMSLMFGVNLPVWGGSKQAPMRREREAMRAMEEARLQNLRNETWAELAALRARANRAVQLDRLYAREILPQARAAVDAAQSAYRVGKADFMTLVESQMTVNRYQTERLRLAAEYHGARAEIEALLGGPGALP